MRLLRPRLRALLGAGTVLALVLTGCGSPNSSKGKASGAAGASTGGAAAAAKLDKSPIAIGYVSDLTGQASPSWADGQGAAHARIEEQNANGGVNGHPLKLVVADDASTPSGNLLAVQTVVNKGAFGVVDLGGLALGGYRYLQQHGIPVTGGGYDGPEWGNKPNSNMFDFNPPAEVGGNVYVSTTLLKFFQDRGVTKLAYFVPSNSPSSEALAHATQKVQGQFGIHPCYIDQSQPIGAVNTTSDALEIKSHGCNGLYAISLDSTSLALAQSLKNAGIANQVTQFYVTGYDQSVLTPTNEAAFDGAFSDNFPLPFSPPTPAGQHMLSVLKQYDSSFKGGIPDVGIQSSWLATDLMIYGLEKAGANPSRSSFITDLRQVTNYSADGLLVPSDSFTGFGTGTSVPKTGCADYEQLTGDHFTLFEGKRLCGAIVNTGPPSL